MFGFLIAMCILFLCLMIKQYQDAEDREKELLHEQFVTSSEAVDSLIRNIQNHLNLMQAKGIDYLRYEMSDADNPLLDSLDRLAWGFALNKKIEQETAKGEYLDAVTGLPLVGNLTGVERDRIVRDSPSECNKKPNSDKPVSDRAEMNMALSMTPLFRAAKENIPNAEWVYYTSDSFIYLFPWRKATPNEHRWTASMLCEQFYTLGLEKNNPDRAIKWTPLYNDHYGAGLMTTAVIPIDLPDDMGQPNSITESGRQYLGTVSIDLTIEDFSKKLKTFATSGTELMIVDNDNVVIAHSMFPDSAFLSGRGIQGNLNKFRKMKNEMYKYAISEFSHGDDGIENNVACYYDSTARIDAGSKRVCYQFKVDEVLPTALARELQRVSVGKLIARLFEDNGNANNSLIDRNGYYLEYHNIRDALDTENRSYLEEKSKSLRGPDWQLLLIHRKQSTFVMFAEHGGIFILLSAVGLFVLVFWVKYRTSTDIVIPAQQLVSHIDQEQRNKPGLIPDVPEYWVKWFSAISETFQKNREFLIEIQEKNESLNARNWNLERYMPKFIVVLNFQRSAGATSVGLLFANQLEKSEFAAQSKTMYMEYPNAYGVKQHLNIDPVSGVFSHPAGFDIWTSLDFATGNNEKLSIESSLMRNIINKHNYKSVVMSINVSDGFDDGTRFLLSYAKAVILLDKAGVGSSDKLKENYRLFKNEAGRLVSPSCRVYSVLSYVDKEIPPYEFDYIGLYENIGVINSSTIEITNDVIAAIDPVVQCISCDHSIQVYIPTTANVNAQMDTTLHLESALDIFGKYFNGATCKQAEGIWNSKEYGLVSETVYIVESMTTESRLNEYKDTIFDFAKRLKSELAQDAIAIYIDGKLNLV